MFLAFSIPKCPKNSKVSSELVPFFYSWMAAVSDPGLAVDTVIMKAVHFEANYNQQALIYLGTRQGCQFTLQTQILSRAEVISMFLFGMQLFFCSLTSSCYMSRLSSDIMH